MFGLTSYKKDVTTSSSVFKDVWVYKVVPEIKVLLVTEEELLNAAEGAADRSP